MNRLRESSLFVERGRYYSYLNYLNCRSSSQAQKILVTRWRNLYADQWSDLEPSCVPSRESSGTRSSSDNTSNGSGISKDGVVSAIALMLASKSSAAKREVISNYRK